MRVHPLFVFVDNIERGRTSITNTADDTELSITIGLQPDQNSSGDIQSCEWAFDNVMVEFPP